jgi:hypothetical protein
LKRSEERGKIDKERKIIKRKRRGRRREKGEKIDTEMLIVWMKREKIKEERERERENKEKREKGKIGAKREKKGR